MFSIYKKLSFKRKYEMERSDGNMKTNKQTNEQTYKNSKTNNNEQFYALETVNNIFSCFFTKQNQTQYQL